MNRTDEQKAQLRNFGLLVGGITVCLGLVPALSGGRPNYWLLWAGGALFSAGLLFPFALSNIYSLWMRAGHLLGKINSFVLLSLMYYLVITPVGRLKRLISPDRRFSFRTGAGSYWIRRAPEDLKETMRRQF